MRHVKKLQLANLAEMVSVDCQGDCQGQKFRTAAKGPHHQVPVLDAFPAENSDSDRGAEKGQKTLEVQFNGNFRWLIFPQKGFDPLVIGSGPVDAV